jgi:ABC-type taurine transport system substrate-binding protein
MAVKKITTYDLEIQVLASDRLKNVVQLNRFHLFDVFSFLKNSIYLKSRIKVCFKHLPYDHGHDSLLERMKVHTYIFLKKQEKQDTKGKYSTYIYNKYVKCK